MRILKEIESVSPKKRAKRVGVIRDKMCDLDIQDLLLLYIMGENLNFNLILKKIFLYGKNKHFILYNPYPFCAYFKRSPKICAKRAGVMKDKI